MRRRRCVLLPYAARHTLKTCGPCGWALNGRRNGVRITVVDEGRGVGDGISCAVVTDEVLHVFFRLHLLE